MARLWCRTVAVALTAAVATTCVALGLQGAALADSKKPRFGTHPPVKIKPYVKRLFLNCTATTATIKGLSWTEHKVKIRNVKWGTIKTGQTIYWQSRTRRGAKPKYSGQYVLQWALMQGYSIDFKVSNQMKYGCSAWANASLIKRR